MVYTETRKVEIVIEVPFEGTYEDLYTRFEEADFIQFAHGMVEEALKGGITSITRFPSGPRVHLTAPTVTVDEDGMSYTPPFVRR